MSNQANVNAPVYNVENVGKFLSAKDGNSVLMHMVSKGTQDVRLALEACGLLDKFEAKLKAPLRAGLKDKIMQQMSGMFLKWVCGYMTLSNANTLTMTFHMKGKYVWCARMSAGNRRNLPEPVKGLSEDRMIDAPGKAV